MPRPPEIGNVQLYPNRPLRASDKNGFVLKFYCPLQGKRIRKNACTRNRREARKIMRECRERLLNGEYVASGGVITKQQEATRVAVSVSLRNTAPPLDESNGERSWSDCQEQYLQYKRKRVREKSYKDIVSRLGIAERILNGWQEDHGLASSISIRRACTLESLEYLQDRLLEGDHCRYDSRAPMTVNTMMGTIMTFVRHCSRHRWISEVPPIEALDVDSWMKGRPVTPQEFAQLLQATADIVGQGVAESWKFTLQTLWQTAFRISDVMNFSWDDDRYIHPIWPSGTTNFPTLQIPAKQKNKKLQEIPMLPGLKRLLEGVPESERQSWVVDPRPIEFQRDSKRTWVRPADTDLKRLATIYSNSAIARACSVSETTARKWLNQLKLDTAGRDRNRVIPQDMVDRIWRDGQLNGKTVVQNQSQRLTKERVGRVISMIGKQANIVVQEEDRRAGKRIKYASAHDIRRGCAQRLINEGISAETLKLLLRHSDFGTTEKYYGASRNAQSAAKEIYDNRDNDDGATNGSKLTNDEIAKLREILDLTGL